MLDVRDPDNFFSSKIKKELNKSMNERNHRVGGTGERSLSDAKISDQRLDLSRSYPSEESPSVDAVKGQLVISLASRGAHTLATPHSQLHRDVLSLPAPNQQLCSNSCNQTQLMNSPLSSQHINNNIVHSPNNLNSNNNNNNSNVNNNSVPPPPPPPPPGSGDNQENTQPNAVSRIS